MIYTSGSTGTPKGVLVEHRSVVRLLRQTEPWFGFGPSDVWTMFHSASFDFSVWEIWGALAYGGRVVIVPYEVSRSPAAFLDLLGRESVTVLDQTPTAFRQLVTADATRPGTDLGALRLVILGGERLDVGLLEPWVARHGDQRPELVNMYGITETTVHASYRRIGLADLADSAVSPVGVPLPDLCFELLDESGAPVAPGQPGELYVSGPGLARGYLNRGDLTASRFLGLPGARSYRTGDRLLALDDGQYVYLGRTDDQIKVRGFRVEPGEIEAVLTGHAEVGGSIVVARDHGEGDVRLVAYLLPAAGVAADQAWVDRVQGEVADLVAQALPTHMRPSAYLPLETLPLTANGKVDRSALPWTGHDDLASPPGRRRRAQPDRDGHRRPLVLHPRRAVRRRRRRLLRHRRHLTGPRPHVRSRQPVLRPRSRHHGAARRSHRRGAGRQCRRRCRSCLNRRKPRMT